MTPQIIMELFLACLEGFISSAPVAQGFWGIYETHACQGTAGIPGIAGGGGGLGTFGQAGRLPFEDCGVCALASLLNAATLGSEQAGLSSPSLL